MIAPRIRPGLRTTYSKMDFRIVVVGLADSHLL